MRYLLFTVISILLGCSEPADDKRRNASVEVSETPEINTPQDFYEDCNLEGFESYAGAIQEVRATRFDFSDKIATPESSWIASAEYYSCDGKPAFLYLWLTKAGNTYMQGCRRKFGSSLKMHLQKGVL
jgi:hypothetical protein